MVSRDRVIAAIDGGKPDRMPVYGWVRENMKDVISKKYGSVEAFEDHYEFDFAHIFGGPSPYPGEEIMSIRALEGEVLPERLLDLKMNDVDDISTYKGIIDGIDHYKNKRGRFVYVQTPGIFECLNGPFGIENHLAYMLLYEEEIKKVYEAQAQWNRKFASNCIDLGIDMVHVSDDWGAQKSLLFSPLKWRELIYPNHKIVCDFVKKRNVYLSLHSDGNINEVLDGIIELGYDVLHPYQESAGMDYGAYVGKYKDRFTIMGGLDVQTTIGFSRFDFLEKEIRRIIGSFPNKRLLFCTTHFVQDHCSLEELEFAYNIVRELA
jgi:uroporphyrinogen decarboxylase